MLKMQNICKQWPGIKALDHVTLEAHEGRILALIGVNGAGKSTLMNVLGGVVRQDEGEIWIDDKQVVINSPKDAEDRGISFIHQEPLFFSTMTVAENIYLSDLFPSRVPFLIDKKKAEEESKKLLKMMGVDVNPKALMQALSIGEIQIVEIARSLAKGSKIVIFDEPTSSLSENEKNNLFRIIRSLRDEGKIVIYISHFLDEIGELCDDYLVMRDGRVTGNGLVKDTDKNGLIRMIVGKELDTQSHEKHTVSKNNVILKVQGIRSGNLLKNVSFELRKGEILGIWGLMGSGRTELIRAMLGLDRVDGGEVFLHNGQRLEKVSKRKLLHSCGYVTESRHTDGLFLNMSLWKNASAPNMEKYSRNPLRFMDTKMEKKDAAEYIEQLSMRVPGPDTVLKELSGGNQQKVIFAKWINKNQRILILDEPTRGVDVGAKYEIYRIIRRLVRQGTSVILITDEIDEMVDLSDRVLVLQGGRFVAEAFGEEINNGNLMHKALEGGTAR